MIVVLKLITKSHPWKQFWSACQEPHRKLATFISVDNVRALVTVGELGQFKEVHEVVLPKVDKEYTEAWCD